MDESFIQTNHQVLQLNDQRLHNFLLTTKRHTVQSVCLILLMENKFWRINLRTTKTVYVLNITKHANNLMEEIKEENDRFNVDLKLIKHHFFRFTDILFKETH